MASMSKKALDVLAHDSESDALSKFHEQVVKLSARFTAKEAARACLVSTQYMRKYGVEKGITFASPEGRTPSQMRKLRRELIKLQEEARVRQLKPISPSPGPNGLELTPALDKASRQALWERQNKFIAEIAELAKTNSLHQVRRLTKVGLRALRRVAYDHDIVFADQAEPFNEETANAELIAISKEGVSYPGLPADARCCLAGFLMPAPGRAC